MILMNSTKMIALVLIVVGALALAYGGFTYTKETHDADIGPIHMSVDEKERVNIPIWAGVGAIVLGGVLLVGGFKK
jgi:TRAP-type C4-dicarboxylate transport system permease small subunit